ncbi:TATA-binding protein-associated factor 172 [Portunus trituberculatus]|uniref:TATA-binding protein-associated factor 172 n=1 Tax=Portunus trituberculatus TaxID=210409 RepID=A0A5B7CFB4_PORTR|nr:TATA-binding protein-associated factor 172 [Portunus trituberculatus]
MSTRLDRLFVLLENGGSGVTRGAAAQQLGEVVRLHPQELSSLLGRVHSLLTSKSWDVRIAAGLAVEAIVSNVPAWDPSPAPSSGVFGEDTTRVNPPRLSLHAFSIKRVLERAIDPSARLAQQQRLVNQRLGLDVAEAVGVDVRGIVSPDDLASGVEQDGVGLAAGQGKDSVLSIVRKEIKSARLMLSSRELNRARRKAKLMARQKSVDVSECVGEDEPEPKRLCVEDTMVAGGSDDEDRMVVDEGSSALPEGGCEWPLESFCNNLAADLFSMSWETRHGVATALRHIIRVQGRGAGRAKYHTRQQMENSHQAWLEDMAVRLVCVLALDRFGDFVSDQVVAPVRETCAQTIGSILHLMSEDGVYGVLGLLEEMLCWQGWETRHGGLLGLKYLLAVREDLHTCLLPRIYPHIYRGLLDEMDEVVAVAASCLVPVAASVVEKLKVETVGCLVATLWDALLDIDDLTSSTSSVLMLLARLMAHPVGHGSLKSDLSQLVPRLWPFLYHTSSTVRGSALKTLDTLTACTDCTVSTSTTTTTTTNSQSSIKITSETCTVTPPEPNVATNNTSTSEQKLTDTTIDTVMDKERTADDDVSEPQVKKECEDESEMCQSSQDTVGSPREVPNANTKECVAVKTENGIKSEECTKDAQPAPMENNTSPSAGSEKKVKFEVVTKEEEKDQERSLAKCKWLHPIIQPLLTHVYQRALLEDAQENLSLVFKIWTQVLRCIPLAQVLPVVCPLVAQWLCLSMTSHKLPMDPSLLLLAHHNKLSEGRKVRIGGESSEQMEAKYYLGGCDQHNNVTEKLRVVTRARCAAARLLGSLSCVVSQPMPGLEYPPDEGPMECYAKLLVAHLVSRSALQRFGAGAVSRAWAATQPPHPCPPILQLALQTCLTEVVYYDEIALSFTRHYKLPLDPALSAAPVLTLEQIQTLSGQTALNLFSMGRLRPKVLATLEERRKAIQSSVSQTSSDQLTLATTTQAIIAGAVVQFEALPAKLNPVIKPLMDSIKKEKNEQLQGVSAEDLTCLLEMCATRSSGPNPKIIKNLANFLCVDQEYTPRVTSTERQLLRRSSSLSARPPGRPPANAKKEDAADLSETILENELQHAAEVQRRGCTLALQNITRHFSSALPQKVPQLWQMLTGPLEHTTSSKNDSVSSTPTSASIDSNSESPSSDKEALKSCPESVKSNAQSLESRSGSVEGGSLLPEQSAKLLPVSPENSQEAVNWLQLMEVVVPGLDPALVEQLGKQAGMLEPWLYHVNAAVRHMAARVLGALARALPVTTLTQLVEIVVPELSSLHCIARRRGAVEAIHCIIQKLGFDVVPYSVLLIVPLLGCMSDPDTSIRLTATQCFATLIRLLPLEGGIPDPPSMSDRMLKQKKREREFLERLLDPSKIVNHSIPIPIHAELRSYQQSGVNWLAFLNQYKLHGILCDDMGLGKTLQSICILASDHYTKEKARLEASEGVGGSDLPPIQSLVVCPPTLTGHWVYEVQKFVDSKYLNPLHYTGPPVERYRLRKFISDHNLVVASYEIVRNDIDFFSLIKWNYVILDEGHVIKNSKTKSCRAIKQLTAQHRLILSGTPIQNNVLELWSLFDFLMPGFLGSERQFMACYSRPILLARDPKSSSRDQEAGVLAMEALHRQTLPFLLRRVKEDVLSDLPPKITQDYYCELSPLQEELYEDFARTQASQSISDTLRSSSRSWEDTNPSSKPQHTHIFQALQYLRKVCNHPKLVLKARHPEYERITAKLKSCNSSLSDISHAAKLPALKQLLLDCGIGTSGSGSNGDGVIVSPHRALIFCQLQGMLDIIEHDLLKVHLPSVTYLRLDGAVPAGARQSLVQRFNSDPSIDLLLLTTLVGGLGLNLTGADTVIFVEHDWNPMKDLQAMDRTHRIGQKRVVNVYRLVTQGTLEEKIMGLQKFKMMTANTVISQENSSLMTMGTSQVRVLCQTRKSN